MKRFNCMNVIRGALLLASTLLVFACGRNETMASKSAAAYREAQAKGSPVTGGHEHGGHEAATATGAASEMDHSAHGTTADAHAGHDMTPSAADHGAHGTSAAVDHGQHGTSHAGAGHTAHTATAGTAPHDQHAGMQHGAASSTAPHAQHQQPSAAPAHAGHGAMQAAAGAPGVVLGAPVTNAEIARTQPAATLRQDDFDAPAPIAVEEARKAAAGSSGHAGHTVPAPKKEK